MPCVSALQIHHHFYRHRPTPSVRSGRGFARDFRSPDANCEAFEGRSATVAKHLLPFLRRAFALADTHSVFMSRTACLATLAADVSAAPALAEHRFHANFHRGVFCVPVKKLLGTYSNPQFRSVRVQRYEPMTPRFFIVYGD